MRGSGGSFESTVDALLPFTAIIFRAAVLILVGMDSARAADFGDRRFRPSIEDGGRCAVGGCGTGGVDADDAGMASPVAPPQIGEEDDMCRRSSGMVVCVPGLASSVSTIRFALGVMPLLCKTIWDSCGTVCASRSRVGSPSSEMGL